MLINFKGLTELLHIYFESFERFILNLLSSTSTLVFPYICLIYFNRFRWYLEWSPKWELCASIISNPLENSVKTWYTALLLYMYYHVYCGVFAPCRSCWSTEASRNAIAQQQWSTAEPLLASLPFPSLRSALCVARLRGKLWITQQWKVMWPLQRHSQQYTTLRSPAYQTPAFIGETEGSSASSVQVSIHMLVATESSRQFATERSQPVRSELSARVEKTASVKRRFTWNIWSVRPL
jgi:hypothetical protein